MPKIATNPISKSIVRPAERGKIELFLDDGGKVKSAQWQAPANLLWNDQRSIDQFLIGRPAEEVPRIAPAICGSCRAAHNMAALRALDDLYGVEPPPAARLIRELEFNAVHIEDLVRFFMDLFAPRLKSSDSDAVLNHIPGILGRVGKDLGLKAIDIRKRNRRIMIHIFGKASHPEGGLPGGVSRGITEQDRIWIRETVAVSLEFARFAIDRFKDSFLADKAYLSRILSETDRLRTYMMAMINERNEADFCGKWVRIVDPAGKEYARFLPGDYREHIGEWKESATTAGFAHLAPLGWQGLTDGKSTSLYRVGALARLNAADAMQTPLAQKEAEFMFATLGGKPAHQTAAVHWARLICGLQAAERNLIIVDDPLLTSKDIRNMNLRLKRRGVGAVEAPSGTVFHDYETDENGMITRAEIMTAPRNNAASICLSIKKAAGEFVLGPDVKDGFLDRIESTFRAYDLFPCHAGMLPVSVSIRNSKGEIIREISRGVIL